MMDIYKMARALAGEINQKNSRAFVKAINAGVNVEEVMRASSLILEVMGKTSEIVPPPVDLSDLVSDMIRTAKNLNTFADVLEKMPLISNIGRKEEGKEEGDDVWK